MNCDNSRIQMYLYSSDELSEQDRLTFEHHIAECEQCQREFESYQTLVRSYQSLPAAPGFRLTAQIVMNRAKRSSVKHIYTKPFRKIPVLAIVMLLLCASAIMLYVLNRPVMRPELQERHFVTIFDRPSPFHRRREKANVSFLQLQAPKEDKIVLLAEKIENLKTSEIRFRSRFDDDTQTQTLKKEVEDLSTPGLKPVQRNLKRSFFRRAIL